MGVTIHVNGKSNSLVHKGSGGIAKNTPPDVCKTPSPGGPVPIPYPVIISLSGDLVKGTKTVKVDGRKMAAIKGSELSRCTGDEPGTAGGVKSSTNMKEATWITSSPDVKLDGKNACRLSDKMQMNHGNTVCLAGFAQLPVAAQDQINDALCQALCDHENEVQNGTRSRRKSDDLERELEAAGTIPNVLFRQRIPTPSGFSTKHTKPDVIADDASQCWDFKLCGDRARGDQMARQAAISGGAQPIIVSCDECTSCNPGCTCP